jgi:hypothetical protein
MPTAERERVVELSEHTDYQLTDWTSAQHDLAAFQREVNRIESAAKALRGLPARGVTGARANQRICALDHVGRER